MVAICGFVNAANAVETPRIESKASTDVCTICVWWPGGGACGSGETCAEALTCLLISLE